MDDATAEIRLDHLGLVLTDPTKVFRWPGRAALAFPGLVKQKTYGAEVRETLRSLGYKSFAGNAPAIAAFEHYGGGEKPRFLEEPSLENYQGWTVGEHAYEQICRESWHIHHIYGDYSGFKANTDGLHFTQAAGLVAVCPPFHGIAEYETSIWDFLWRQAYQRFGYDPLCRYSKRTDEHGFAVREPA